MGGCSGPVSSSLSLEAKGREGALDGLHSSQREESHPEKCYSIKVEPTCLCKERGENRLWHRPSGRLHKLSTCCLGPGGTRLLQAPDASDSGT